MHLEKIAIITWRLVPKYVNMFAAYRDKPSEEGAQGMQKIPLK